MPFREKSFSHFVKSEKCNEKNWAFKQKLTEQNRKDGGIWCNIVWAGERENAKRSGNIKACKVSVWQLIEVNKANLHGLLCWCAVCKIQTDFTYFHRNGNSKHIVSVMVHDGPSNYDGCFKSRTKWMQSWKKTKSTKRSNTISLLWTLY